MVMLLITNSYGYIFNNHKLFKQRRVSYARYRFCFQQRRRREDNSLSLIGGRMGGYDTQTLELAILALLEKEQFEDLKRRYEELVK